MNISIMKNLKYTSIRKFISKNLTVVRIPICAREMLFGKCFDNSTKRPGIIDYEKLMESLSLKRRSVFLSEERRDMLAENKRLGQKYGKYKERVLGARLMHIY